MRLIETISAALSDSSISDSEGEEIIRAYNAQAAAEGPTAGLAALSTIDRMINEQSHMTSQRRTAAALNVHPAAALRISTCARRALPRCE